MEIPYYAIGMYLIPLATIALIYWVRRRQNELESRKLLDESVEAGLTEASSLHPLVNPALCIGCRSCTSACPEGNVLGIIGNKATLVNPADCIGHGACAKACPENAITLVFGSESRGVDIPDLTPNFETSVGGIYVAGELGGMGLIKNAIQQGQDAMSRIGNTLSGTRRNGCEWDCVIVGCGPAGLSAALQAKQMGIRALAFDRGKIGGTVAHFPRKKLVMTAPAELPGVGRVMFHEIKKEDLIGFWQDIVAKHRPLVRESETLKNIERHESGFFVTTNRKKYNTRTVLLAMGRRGTPRTLGVPGEQRTKVVYELEDAAQYRGRHVLVVGGGDSALEAAISIATCSPASLVVSYRGEAFSRARKKNRDGLSQLARRGLIDVRFSSTVEMIKPRSVILQQSGNVWEVENDDVIICIGGVLPTGFMKNIGIAVSTKYGQA